ncbi:type VI secretion system lipoprotein TssJ [Pseudomonas aeruginosa]|uniref:type VI secretion system lipoprotein TssJ n=1 Tax=Pseudomonas aeruginosa TaxID=287 RepID=UPI001FF5B9E9|nr:type VI secretion system lipoprotein TssJ [Pseudomonas aeruginosa]MCK0983409.1 type VI secretion system lipoprotein TssJ [Pseudomonas aeruginosa]MCL8243924.1 type VI secretion system lipoprotein TssJ [Pseudomonas aeruginosa]
MSRRPIPPARALAMLAVLALLAGCSTLSPYSRLTKLDLALSAGERVNPDLNGRPSPVVVRLFELKHPVAFENADFFSLYERPKETLDSDLVTSEELELRPGERVELKLSVEEGSRYVGVLAAYRDHGEASWRYVVPVTAKELTRVELKLGRKGILNAGELLGKAGDAR